MINLDVNTQNGLVNVRRLILLGCALSHLLSGVFWYAFYYYLILN